ncbi:MAG: hypothetical protein ACLU4J_18225 [Butyricimonas paravirosa]
MPPWDSGYTKKYNTLEALLVHRKETIPLDNILGIIAFMIMGSISLALAGLINLFASPTSFQPLSICSTW